MKLVSNAKLLLVGDGEGRGQIQDKVKTLGLEDKVIFTGVRNDVADLLSAMDVFVLPSLYEGYPVVSTEVQAAELPAVFSDNIDKTCKLTKYIEFLSLNDDDEKWVKTILTNSVNRSTGDNQILFEKLDIRSAQSKLDELYSKYISEVESKT